jgi:hypothetical protein
MATRPDDVLDDADRCLLRNSALLALSRPDAAGYLQKRANISGWYRYWFSLHGSQLRYFEVVSSDRRGPLVGTISLFRNKVTVAHSPKRAREIDLIDASAKTHVLRAETDAQLHWWLQVFAFARNKIPPPKPFSASASATLPRPVSVGADLLSTPSASALPRSIETQSRAQGATGSCAGLGTGGGVHAQRAAARLPSTHSAKLSKVDSVPQSNSATKPPFETRTTWTTNALEAMSPGAAEAFSKAATVAASTRSSESQPLDVSEPNNISREVPGGIGPAAAPERPALMTSPATTGSASGMPNTLVESHLPVDHVLFVVHGIGSSEDILTENIRMLQESYNEISAKIFPDLNFRVEMLVVRWREALTKLDVHQKLKSVVPIAPALSGESNPLRQFMVHRIVDYVYYTHDRYRRHIMRTITSQLNELFADFKQRRPDYRGSMSVFCHSLGAALCYDLLCRKYMDDKTLLAAEGMLIEFDVDNLFTAGSPLGTFLHLDPSLALGTDIRTLPFRVYNIFHPNDPIATRLEPYVDLPFVGVHPVLVPYWCNMGVRSSTAQWLGTLWSGSSGKKVAVKSKDANESPHIENEIANGQRYAGYPGGHSALLDSALSKPEDSHTPNSFSQPVLGTFTVEGSDAKHPPSSNVGSSAIGAVMQPSPGQIGLGAGVEVESAVTCSMVSDSELRYFPRGAQDEILASGVFENRLDFVLQLSSAIEEVSTSWSALRAHTDYWSNRDMMLVMISSMVKTSRHIPDNVSRLPSVELDRHLIDSRVRVKDTCVGWSNENDIGASSSAALSTAGSMSLPDAVSVVVEKVIDEASAMHELVQQHPNMRLRRGGITRSTSTPSKHENEVPLMDRAEAKYSGWASYIPWFNSSSDAKSSGSTPSDRSDGRSISVRPPLTKGAGHDTLSHP